MQNPTPRRPPEQDCKTAVKHSPLRINYDFGPFTLRTRDSVLLRDGKIVPMRHKVLETLRVLLEEHGHFISRAELLDRVWPDEFVEESSITQNISLLRRVLDPAFPSHKPIETLSKKGYRFAAPVTMRESEPHALPVAMDGTVFNASIAAGAEASGSSHGSTAGQMLVFAPSRLADAVLARDAEQRIACVSGSLSTADGALHLAEDAKTNQAQNLPATFVPTMLDLTSDGEPSSSAPAPSQGKVQPMPTPSATSHRRMPTIWLVVAAALCLGVLVSSVWLGRRYLKSVTAPRRTIAILSMTNLRSDSQQEWVGPALSEMILADLMADSSLSVISGATVARMRHDLGLPTPGDAQETVASICEHLGCTHTIIGNFLVENDKVWLDLKLQDGTTGRVLTVLSVTGREDELHQLTLATVEKLRNQLGLEAPHIQRPLEIHGTGLRDDRTWLRSLRADHLPAAYTVISEAIHSALKSAGQWEHALLGRVTNRDAKLKVSSPSDLEAADHFSVRKRSGSCRVFLLHST